MTSSNQLFNRPDIISGTVREKKSKPKKKLVKTFLLLVLLGGFFWFIFYSPIFQIKNITLEGVQANSDLIAEMNKFKGKNIFLMAVDSEKRNLIIKQPEIKDIVIWKGLPDTLKAKLTLRDKVLIWQSADRFYYVDGDGIAFKQRGPLALEEKNILLIIDKKNVLVNLGTQFLSPVFVKFVTQLATDLPTISAQIQVPITLTNIDVEESTLQTTAQTAEGFKILFDTTRPVDSQLAALKKVLSEHRSEVTEYVDVRVQGWAYFK